jgi:hypothetical protein
MSAMEITDGTIPNQTSNELVSFIYGTDDDKVQVQVRKWVLCLFSFFRNINEINLYARVETAYFYFLSFFEICNIIIEQPFFSALPLLLAVIIISSSLISIFIMGRYFSREEMRWEIQIWVKWKMCQIYEWFSRNRLSSGRFDRGSRTWLEFLNIGQIFLVFKEVSTQLNSDRIRSSLELFKFPFNFFLMEIIKSSRSFDLKAMKQIMSAGLSFKKLKAILDIIKPLRKTSLS